MWPNHVVQPQSCKRLLVEIDKFETEMSNTGGSEANSSSVEPTYVYLGPKTIAKLKMRLADWLERRGW